ncbi:PREDICTED: transcription factor RF2b isoform X1 [Theobroma cacao]|uniref:Transcription factor RF2b isoform X1 n=1 Tax=Theobroma cacao TaxID=3641 RepID=A0AB32UMX1_THECC|nr:PREDICTED: transcription factor RF2b isoform X1 [Theobroma cacao]
MPDPPSLSPNPDQPIHSNASSTTQTTPSFANPTTFRGSYHRRAQSEVQFRIPDDLDLVSDPFEGLGSEDDLFCSYMDIEKLGGSSKGADEGGAAGSSSAGSGQNPKGGEETSGGSGMGEKSTGGGKGRHRYSNSVDGCSMMESIEAKKAMAPDKLAELWTVDPKRAKRIIANRQSAARSKERKARYISELERKVQTLQTEATTLSAQLTLFQRDTTGLSTENTELKLRLQAMEQQAQLRDGMFCPNQLALNEALKKEVERLKIATGEMTTPTDTFNLGMHHIPYTQSSYFPPQPQHVQVDTQNIQMPQFHPFQSNMLTPNQSVVAASNSHAYADMMQQDPLGRLQGLDISSRGSRLVKSEGPSISAGEHGGTL